VTSDIKHQTITSLILRGRLEQVKARYDYGAVPPSLYKAIQEMEREIAWTEHRSTGGEGE
jgi:hypothetical protein